MTDKYYSEMTDRELFEHMARNSDQLIGHAMASPPTTRIIWNGGVERETPQWVKDLVTFGVVVLIIACVIDAVTNQPLQDTE